MTILSHCSHAVEFTLHPTAVITYDHVAPYDGGNQQLWGKVIDSVRGVSRPHQITSVTDSTSARDMKKTEAINEGMNICEVHTVRADRESASFHAPLN